MTAPYTLLKTQNLRAKKDWGQNFLADPSVPARIAALANITKADTVLEIGAGLGALTLSVASAAGMVHAVEKDRTLIPLLKKELTGAGLDNVEVYESSIFNIDMGRIREEAGGKLVIAGNLPYNLSSHILLFLIAQRQHIKRAVLMFQKEMARRLTAGPGNRDYGRLSVLLQYCASDVNRLMNIKAASFFPKPAVDSEVIEIRFAETPVHHAQDEDLFIKTVKACFGKRRKTLKNALAGSEFKFAASDAAKILEAAAIDPSRRAETLSVEEFVRLSNVLYDITYKEI